MQHITSEQGLEEIKQNTGYEAFHQGSVEKKIIIAAANSLVVRGLAQYLEQSPFRVAALVSSTNDLLPAIRHIHPDVVILELPMQSNDGFERIQEIHEQFPNIRLLVLANYTMPSLVKIIFRAGASGYLLSMPAQSVMIQALEAIITQNTVLDKQLQYIKTLVQDNTLRQCLVM